MRNDYLVQLWGIPKDVKEAIWLVINTFAQGTVKTSYLQTRKFKDKERDYREHILTFFNTVDR